MSNDSEKTPSGKPIAEGIRKEDLHKVSGSPFVDWRSRTDESDLIRMMMAPMQGIVNKIDAKLAAFEQRLAALDLRTSRSPFKSCADFET